MDEKFIVQSYIQTVPCQLLFNELTDLTQSMYFIDHMRLTKYNQPPLKQNGILFIFATQLAFYEKTVSPVFFSDTLPPISTSTN
jgi:hypothetical protein